MNEAARIVRTYTFTVRTPEPLATPESAQQVREKLARTSVGYQAAMADPFGILASKNTTDDIPF
ncbi:hypothetical protein [Micromonospora aurantiaca (nom. illeg.)]|uniref:hypothetical protein n=1 Tax=Micromonospora aurantiaca (nom. illeg.) TaxID=47850 RepID=UPI00119DA13F|nr:hypothetical protein [Micromonospora aurantiaca]MBC9005157.1 hypothetical protein [Micromonospora aurantiaca]